MAVGVGPRQHEPNIEVGVGFDGFEIVRELPYPKLTRSLADIIPGILGQDLTAVLAYSDHAHARIRGRAEREK